MGDILCMPGDKSVTETIHHQWWARPQETGQQAGGMSTREERLFFDPSHLFES